MKRTCLACGRVIATGSRCRACQQRNGSTRAWRDLREHILLRDRGTCHYCGAPAGHVDHVVPIAHGGPTHEANLVAACQTCNLKKGRGAAPLVGGRRPISP